MTIQLVNDPGITNSYIITGDLSSENTALFENWCLENPSNVGAFFIASASKATLDITGYSAEPAVIAAYCFGDEAECTPIMEPLLQNFTCTNISPIGDACYSMTSYNS